MRAVSNAGPIIHLSWVNRLDLLGQLFEEVIVPVAVRDEVLRAAEGVLGVPAIRRAFDAEQFRVHDVTDWSEVAELEAYLHRGETEAILLMQQLRADLLLLDDRVARDHAQKRGMPIAGTLGILLMARERRLIPRAVPVIDELQQLGFRVSDALIDVIRSQEEQNARE